jgi:hypothetical protein
MPSIHNKSYLQIRLSQQLNMHIKHAPVCGYLNFELLVETGKPMRFYVPKEHLQVALQEGPS